jgi:Ca2+-binding EF-hand superfamily protein
MDGSGVFTGELRRMFSKADRDQNGKLETEELK